VIIRTATPYVFLLLLSSISYFFDCVGSGVDNARTKSTNLNFLLWDDTTHCSRTVSSFWWEPLLGTLHFQPKQAIGGTNLADSARELN
jgi:hypothetical protein